MHAAQTLFCSDFFFGLASVLHAASLKTTPSKKEREASLTRPGKLFRLWSRTIITTCKIFLLRGVNLQLIWHGQGRGRAAPAVPAAVRHDNWRSVSDARRLPESLDPGSQNNLPRARRGASIAIPLRHGHAVRRHDAQAQRADIEASPGLLSEAGRRHAREHARRRRRLRITRHGLPAKEEMDLMQYVCDDASDNDKRRPPAAQLFLTGALKQIPRAC